MGTGLKWLMIEYNCDHSNGSSDVIEGGIFFVRQENKFSKQDSTVCSYNDVALRLLTRYFLLMTWTGELQCDFVSTSSVSCLRSQCTSSL